MTTEHPTGAGAPSRRTLSVFLCDDKQKIREAIQMMLAGQPDYRVVGEAADGLSGLEEVRALQPDILILDVNMPGGGPQIAREAKLACPRMRILVYSGSTDAKGRHQMLDAVADDFVLKTGRIRHLLDGLGRVAQSL